MPLITFFFSLYTPVSFYASTLLASIRLSDLRHHELSLARDDLSPVTMVIFRFNELVKSDRG